MRQKYASQASPELLQAMHQIAEQEGRQFQAVMEDAMREYLERRNDSNVRSEMLRHFRQSVERNRELAKLLAK